MISNRLQNTARFIVINSSQLSRTLLSNYLRQRYPQHEIHDVACIDSALRIVAADPKPRTKPLKTLFVVGYFSYLKQLEILRRIKVCCPNSRIILLDRRPKFGCSFVVHRRSIHGYVTTFDPPEILLTCIDRVAEDRAFHSPDSACYLRCDSHKKTLLCHENLHKNAPHSLSDKEWLCFQYMLSNQNLDELADLVQLKPRSVRNMKYRVMSKLQVKSMTEMIRLAHQWGFLED